MAAGIDDTISCLGGLLGGFLLVYGLCSLVFKEKLYISEAGRWPTQFSERNNRLVDSCNVFFSYSCSSAMWDSRRSIWDWSDSH